MTARVLVVEHQKNAGLGQLAPRLRANGLELVTVGPDTGESVPGSLDGFDALIVLGGAMGPTEDERAPWLPATRSLITEAIDSETPMLGICLGAQLLATAAGGHVRTMPAGPEVGLCKVEFAESASADPVFGGIASSTLPVVQWHWLEADTLPLNTEVLASSDACANQAFRVGSTAWGVQFHPEALGPTASDWVDEDPDSLDELGLDPRQIIAAVTDAEPRLGAAWLPIADRFAAVVTQAS